MWRRLGPDGGTSILLLGTKTVPLCDRAAAGGTTGFESRTAKAPPRDDVTRKKKNQHRCSADSCAVHTARWSCWHQGSEILCCCRSGIGLEGKDSMIGWWLVHEGCMINGSTHIFSFFKRKRNDNEGFDDVYYIVVLAP